MIPRICAYAQAAIVCSAIGACGGKVPARSATVLESPHAVEVPTGAETISLLGDTLVAPEQPPDVRAVYLARYREAEEALSQAPDDVEAPIWDGASHSVSRAVSGGDRHLHPRDDPPPG